MHTRETASETNTPKPKKPRRPAVPYAVDRTRVDAAESCTALPDFRDYSSEYLAKMKKPTVLLSRKEAVALIGDIHQEIEALEDHMLRLRWSLGFVLKHTERPYGQSRIIIDEISKDLWEQHNIRMARTLLYECQRLYVAFAGDFMAFLKWIEEQKAILGRPVYWSDIQRLIFGGRSNPDVIGPEEADERDYRDAERGIEAIERIIMRAQLGNEEAQGVIEGIRQSVAGLLIWSQGLPATPRSDEYLEFVRSHPCAVCKKPADSHHAFGRRGIGVKSSDYTCVPLCRVHHIELHRTHRRQFESDYQIDLVEVAFNLLHRYLTGLWATMVLSDRSEI